MTDHNELVEKVARAVCCQKGGECGSLEIGFCVSHAWVSEARAAIAVALEEAAKVVEKTFGEGYHVAAAIRAMKEKAHDKT